MAEYISREALLKEFDELLQVARDNNEGWPWDEGQIYGLEKAIEDAKELPAADVVEVVRCKDCKWCHAGYCEKYDDLIPFGCANKPWEDWFCADGKR